MKIRLLILTTLLASIFNNVVYSANTDININTEAVELQHTEIWSKANISLIERVYSKDYVGHFPGGQTIRGRDGIIKMVKAHFIAFPDWNEEILQLIVQGNYISSHYRSTATHKGEFLGVSASDNKVDITEASIYRMVDGKIAEQWAYPDVPSLLQQISSKTEK